MANARVDRASKRWSVLLFWLIVLASSFTNIWVGAFGCLNGHSFYITRANFWEALIAAIVWPRLFVSDVSTPIWDVTAVLVVLAVAKGLTVCLFHKRKETTVAD